MVAKGFECLLVVYAVAITFWGYSMQLKCLDVGSS